MRPRLILIVLALVVLPTAILSIAASRALRFQELTLQKRMESAAVEAINSVSSRVGDALDADVDRICVAFSDCLARGGKHDDLNAVANRLADSRGVIRQVYLFMNPWGFVYPEESGGQGADRETTQQVWKTRASGEAEGSRVRFSVAAYDRSFDAAQGRQPATMDDLLAVVRREIVSAAGNHPLKFTVSGESYVFAPLRNNKGLYAGFKIDAEKFAGQLSLMVDSVSREGLVLVAEGPGFVVTAPKHLAESEVIITDSLSPNSSEIISALTFAKEASKADSAGETGRQRDTVEPLKVANLPRPFEYVKITAFLKETPGYAHSARSQARLYGWGIFLLACGIVAGTWVIIREAGTEVRMAKARSDFVVGVSHDLRTPLSAMKMLAESLYLEHVSEPDKRKQFLGAIMRESERLSQLVERVIFFVRFGENTLGCHFQEEDVGKTVESAVDAFKARFACSPEPDIRVDIEPHLSPVRMDGTAITQVVLNLLDNAWKYGKRRHEEGIGEAENRGNGETEKSEKKEISNIEHSISNTQVKVQDSSLPPSPGSYGEARKTPAFAETTAGKQDSIKEDGGQESGTTIEGQASEDSGFRSQVSGFPSSSFILVSVRRSGYRNRLFGGPREAVCISVRDYGPGIERRELKKIFRRFYRVPGSQGENVSGVGLGLALCRHIARAHGGRIDVESKPGEGSVFSVILPVAGYRSE